MFNNKTILITGGTGSFGLNFCKTVLKKYKPKKIIIYSRDEFKQFEMRKLLKDNPKLRFFIGDVRDFNRLDVAMYGVNYVIHAAALKQVDVAEYNPTEFINTNITGAENVIKASVKNNIEKVIALSTDKAANPINLYGATKLVSDKLFSAANNIKGDRKISFSIVRYGNVINSRGSVIPFFNNIIKSKKNFLPITNENMTRFLITIDQAIDFVIFSFKIMKGGEVIVPKLPSIKIARLAKIMAPKLSQKIIGIRPGEKIDEIMCPRDDSHLVVEYKKYFLICPTIEFNKKNDFLSNINGEKGKKVKLLFQYDSKISHVNLTDKQVLKLIK
jgi:UDP-N-acetylglucosamine 4,6-dehydratase/5-epimerase